MSCDPSICALHDAELLSHHCSANYTCTMREHTGAITRILGTSCNGYRMVAAAALIPSGFSVPEAVLYWLRRAQCLCEPLYSDKSSVYCREYACRIQSMGNSTGTRMTRRRDRGNVAFRESGENAVKSYLSVQIWNVCTTFCGSGR